MQILLYFLSSDLPKTPAMDASIAGVLYPWLSLWESQECSAKQGYGASLDVRVFLFWRLDAVRICRYNQDTEFPTYLKEGVFLLYLGLLLLAGVLQGIMVSLNAQLGTYFSLFGICFFVHGIALILLLGYLLIKRQPLRFSGAPWYVYLVGGMGIIIVASSSWCTLHVGASAFMALSTAGQLVSSALIDRFGLFGMPVTRIRKQQLPGYALVLLGVILVVLN